MRLHQRSFPAHRRTGRWLPCCSCFWVNAFLSKQPFLVKLCHIFHIFLKGFGSGDIGQFPRQSQRFWFHNHKGCQSSKQQIRFPPHRLRSEVSHRSDPRFPFASSSLNAFSTSYSLIQALRLLQAQIIHPSFIDPIGCHRAILSLDARQGINVSV